MALRQAEVDFGIAAKGRHYRARAPLTVSASDYPAAVTLRVSGASANQSHRVFAFHTDSELRSFLAAHPRARQL